MSKDRKFVAVNMHGAETKNDFVVPKNSRIILFCYSGCILHIGTKFDIFNWKRIFLDTNVCRNYYNFLETLIKYPTYRNHFCVYNEGQVLKDIEFFPDDNFRDGIFTLPIKASVFDEKTETVYISDSSVFDKLAPIKARRIIVSKTKVAKMIRTKDVQSNIYSRHNIPLFRMKLSSYVNNYISSKGGATFLLLTCREGEIQNIRKSIKLKREFRLVQKERDKRRMMINYKIQSSYF